MGPYSINAQTIEHSILGCQVKKASSQIQIALQLFASTGKKVLQFYGNMFTDIFWLHMMYGAQCTYSSVTVDVMPA